MQGDADAGKAPGLIDAQVGDDVRHPKAEAGARVINRHTVVVDDRTVEAKEPRRHRVKSEGLADGRVFEREGRGETVAELGRIGP